MYLCVYHYSIIIIYFSLQIYNQMNTVKTTLFLFCVLPQLNFAFDKPSRHLDDKWKEYKVTQVNVENSVFHSGLDELFQIFFFHKFLVLSQFKLILDRNSTIGRTIQQLKKEEDLIGKRIITKF